MNQDEFLLITSQGWKEIPNGYDLIQHDFTTISNAIQDGLYLTVAYIFDETDHIPAGHVLTGMRLVGTSDQFNPYRLFIKTEIAPEA